jgi:prepilin-type N-terminal cleavage/methylation domain-containing protein
MIQSHAGAAKRGFTLVEIMVVVCIIGFIALMAFPAIMMSRQSAKNARFINDLRQTGAIFEQHALETGYYPDDTGPGELPTGMETDLRPVHFDQATPLGGQWEWDFDSYGVTAAVSVVGVDATETDMIKIDQRIDDGDLSSGMFRQRDGGYMLIIE